MDGYNYTPDTISIQQFTEYLKMDITPIEGLVIPNVTIPSHLMNKKGLHKLMIQLFLTLDIYLIV